MKINRIKNNLPKIRIYGDKTLKIAFEFGVVLSETSRKMNIEVTEKIVVRAENVLINEIKENGFKKTALNFTPLILAVLEIEEKTPGK